MSRIFLNYRRHWASGHAGRLYDRLALHFGDDNVFMDIEIGLGINFVSYINQMVQQCDVLLAVIDRDWLTMTDAEGQRRLDLPNDFVCLEIAAALNRNIPVIPIYVQDATPPRETALPEVIKRLAQFQGLHLSDLRFHTDVDRLIQALDRMLQEASSEPLPGAPPEPPPAVEPETITNDIGMTFVRIPAGEFLMGTADAQVEALIRRYPNISREVLECETPQHQVTISRPFYLGIQPVTQAQWEQVMSRNPSHFDGKPENPVEQVSWDEAQAFIQKLNERQGVPRYSLPTEAQWEYACRAGSTDLYCFGDDEAELTSYAWTSENANGAPHPVGEKRENTWDLYDMHGNVWEWVQDWYASYTAESVTDPTGPDAGVDRVIRGGCWNYSARYARSASRFRDPPGDRYGNLGFRCLSSGPSQ